MYHVSTHGIDERMINVHYYYYYVPLSHSHCFQASSRFCMLHCLILDVSRQVLDSVCLFHSLILAVSR